MRVTRPSARAGTRWCALVRDYYAAHTAPCRGGVKAWLTRGAIDRRKPAHLEDAATVRRVAFGARWNIARNPKFSFHARVRIPGTPRPFRYL